MSVNLMSAIFRTEFHDLPLPDCDKDNKSRMAKASSLKLVLLAIADCANDEGESAYPGITLLERKTALSRQGVIDILSALKFNGILTIDEKSSKLGTNNYTLNLSCFPCLEDKSQDMLVKPLDYPSQATLPEVVKPLDHIHHLTIMNPSTAITKNEIAKTGGIDWMVAAGLSEEDIAKDNERIQREKEITDQFERAMGFNPLSWDSDKNLKRLKRFLLDKSPEEIKVFASWSRREYSTCTPAKVRQNPNLAIDLWPQAFSIETPAQAYRTL